MLTCSVCKWSEPQSPFKAINAPFYRPIWLRLEIISIKRAWNEANIDSKWNSHLPCASNTPTHMDVDAWKQLGYCHVSIRSPKASAKREKPYQENRTSSIDVARSCEWELRFETRIYFRFHWEHSEDQKGFYSANRNDEALHQLVTSIKKALSRVIEHI